MRIAVPTREGVFCEHFGRCTGFFLCDVEADGRLGRTRAISRGRAGSKCESLPDWLSRLGVTTVLAGGIGGVARHHLEQLGIEVSAGHTWREPLLVVGEFLAAPAGSRKNRCDELEHRHRHCRAERS